MEKRPTSVDDPVALLMLTTPPRWPDLRSTDTLNSSITTLDDFAAAGTGTVMRAGAAAVAVPPAVARLDSAMIHSASASSGSRQNDTRPIVNGRLTITDS